MRIFSLLTALVVAGSAFAQRIEWGELQKVTGRLWRVLPVEGASFFTHRYASSGLMGSQSLARYEDFSLLTKEKILPKVEGSVALINDVISMNGKVLVFLADRREGQNLLYMQQYGDDCLPEGAPRLLAEYTLPKGWNRDSYFNVRQSQNQEFFCVEYSIPGKNDEHDRFGFKVLNAAFETVSEGEYESPYEANISSISNRYLSNTGDYFIAMKVYQANEKGRVRDYSVLEKVVLMQVHPEGVEEMILSLGGDKNITEMTFSSNNNNLMTFNGLYGEGINSAKGVFYFQLDFNKKEFLNKGFTEFSQDFITADWSDREKERAEKREAKGKGSPELYNYEIRDNVTLPDGSLVGTIEQFYIVTRTTYDSRGYARTMYYYYYNDVIAYKISAAGEFEWLSKIQKYQQSVNDGGYSSSIASYVTDNKLVVLFNDNARNYDEFGNYAAGNNPSGASYTKRSNCVARVELDLATGESERRLFFGREEAEAIAVPKLFLTDYKNKQMLMVLRIGKKEKYGLINFRESF